MPDPRNQLSDPHYASFAWTRFRRIMRWMALAAILSAMLALLYLWNSGAPMTVHLIIATVLGVLFTVLLGTALMGLAFLSSGSGHDRDADGSAR